MLRLKTRPLLFVALLGFISCSTGSQPRIVENDEHPFPDAVLATFSSLAFEAQSEGFKNSLNKYRIKIPGFRNPLPLWFWHNPQAENIFVLLPGFGGSPETPVHITVAEALWEQGHSVLSLASTTHELFGQNVSPKRRPGHLPQDLAELENALGHSIHQLRRNFPDRFDNKKLNLIGLSYGALQTIAWAGAQDSVDTAAKAAARPLVVPLKFSAFVALSPPIDLSYALTHLDQSFEKGAKQYLDAQGNLSSQLHQKIEITRERRLLIPEILAAFSTAELEFLLAWDFRKSLQRIIGSKSQNPRDISFEGYIKTVLIPSLQPLSSWEQWSRQNSLRPLLETQVSWPQSLIVFHSLNDFLAEGSDILQLKDSLKDQATLYRHGGHLGYVWSQRFKRDLQNHIKSLNTSN